jgi:hypothetical protein
MTMHAILGTVVRSPLSIVHCPFPFWKTITDLTAGTESIRARRYGMIEVADGRLRAVLLRPWPKIILGPEILTVGRWMHERRSGDSIRLFYNQPLRCPNFLALTYAISHRQTSYRTLRRALEVLDEIARLKHSDALLCDVGNARISKRFMAHWGWEPHCPSRWHRHYIKRFYGNYPPRPAWLAGSVAAEAAH